jgi:hypothetical protein
MGGRQWKFWAGVNGRQFARLAGSSPPVVVTAATRPELFWLIGAAERQLDAGTYWLAVLGDREDV